MKKFLLITLSLLLITSTATAASINLIGSYSLANSFTLEGEYEPTGDDIDDEVLGSSALVIGVEYTDVLDESLSWAAGISYELDRTFTETEELGDFSDEPQMTFLNFYGNVNYALNPQIYAFGGVNYALPSITEEGDLSSWDLTANGGFGLQIGMGHKFSDEFSFEAVYKILSFTFESDDLDFNPTNLRGISAQFKYNLPL